MYFCGSQQSRFFLNYNNNNNKHFSLCRRDDGRLASHTHTLLRPDGRHLRVCPRGQTTSVHSWRAWLPGDAVFPRRNFCLCNRNCCTAYNWWCQLFLRSPSSFFTHPTKTWFWLKVSRRLPKPDSIESFSQIRRLIGRHYS